MHPHTVVQCHIHMQYSMSTTVYIRNNTVYSYVEINFTALYFATVLIKIGKAYVEITCNNNLI